MARTVLTVHDVTADGGYNITNGLSAANEDGHSIANSDENVTLIAKNASAGVLTVTIQTPREIDGLAIAEETWTVAAGQTYIGKFMDRDVYNQSTGVVYVDYSVHADITVDAIKITK